MINLKKLQKIGLLLKKELNESKIFDVIFNVIFQSINFDYGTIFLNSTWCSWKKTSTLELIDNVKVSWASDKESAADSGKST